jgi:predicted nucleic acid-binding protein
MDRSCIVEKGVQVNKSGLSSYDCEFISLAEDLEAKLITTDKQILQSFSGRTAKPSDVITPTIFTTVSNNPSICFFLR